MKLSLILVSIFVLMFMVNPFFMPVMAQEQPVSQFESPVPPVEEPEPVAPGIDWKQILDDLFAGESMVEAVELAIAALLGLFGLGNLTQVIVNALKKINWGLLTLGQKEKLGGEVAEVVAYLVAVLLTYVSTNFLLPLADKIDTLGIFAIGVTVWAFARQIYFNRKRNA